MNSPSLQKLLFISLLTLFISACSTGVSFNPVTFFKGQKLKQSCEELAGVSENKAHLSMNNDIYVLQQNIERSLVFREKISEKLAEIDELTQQEKPFSPTLINGLSKTIKHEIDLMRPILATIGKHGCWVKDDNLQVNKGVKLKGNMIVLATLVSLYDEYGTVFAVINKNERLRRFLNHADSGYQRDEYLLESLSNMFIDTDMLSYATDLTAQYNQYKQRIDELAQQDENLSYLVRVVEQSKSYPVLLKMNYFDAANYRRKVRRRVTRDTLNDINRSIMNGLSKGFSNAVGDYENRKGLLYQDLAVEKSITSQLQMGDILLEKTPFRLTDSMIPGHWGHAAIWIGTEQELTQLGLWQHPLVKEYHQQIKQGKLIAESLRTGTTLSSLSHFLNVDDFAIIRSKHPLSPNQMRETILLTLRQLGKAYDFNFDVETTDKIVCSQLVYLAYTNINWPTESTLGRHTISPDNIAIKALNGGPFELINFYHGGELVHENKVALMGELMAVE
jgi:uncharacterized protein YycO